MHVQAFPTLWAGRDRSENAWKHPKGYDTVSWKRYKLWCACCSVTKLCLTLRDPVNAAHHPSQSPVFAQIHSIESAMLSNHLILCCPFLLPSVFPITRVFPDESVLPIRWPKYWSFSFSISPSNEYSGLTSFSIWCEAGLVVLNSLNVCLQKAETSLCQQTSIQSKLWFYQ